jgi:NAD(P)H-dependent flavin oxidoreductase YrpB (nitropropane dioxygenase family)
MWKTRITDQYRLEIPFIGTGKAFYANAPLVAAVSEAGGMGMLAASPLPPERLRLLIQETRALTARPFGIHFGLSFTESEHVEVCLEERVAVVSFEGEEPPEAFIARLRAGRIRAWMQVASLSAAQAAIEARADAVIVQCENMESLALLPAIVSAVAPVPVIAGDIKEGRCVAAALALGADALSVGARLAASREASLCQEDSSVPRESIAVIHDNRPVATILDEIMQQAEETIRLRLASE